MSGGSAEGLARTMEEAGGFVSEDFRKKFEQALREGTKTD